VSARGAELAGETAKRQLSLVRRVASEALLAVADPHRVPERGEQAVGLVRATKAQLDAGGDGDRSPLWSRRSRRRRLEVLSLPFGPVKEAAGALGGSVNDFFVTGAVAGAAAYHEAEGCALDRLTVTFIVSTREDATAGGNAFTPSKAHLPAGPMAPGERFAAVRDILGERRSEVGDGSGLLASLAGVANLMPTSVVTRMARGQAKGVDFATSNVRAAPFDVYVGGAKVTASYPVGPVAGTAFNVTLMSYSGSLHLGLHIDPVAVAEPERLRLCLERAYAELIDAGGAGAGPAGNGAVADGGPRRSGRRKPRGGAGASTRGAPKSRTDGAKGRSGRQPAAPVSSRRRTSPSRA
jgi:hypothetical protein